MLLPNGLNNSSKPRFVKQICFHLQRSYCCICKCKLLLTVNLLQIWVKTLIWVLSWLQTLLKTALLWRRRDTTAWMMRKPHEIKACWTVTLNKNDFIYLFICQVNGIFTILKQQAMQRTAGIWENKNNNLHFWLRNHLHMERDQETILTRSDAQKECFCCVWHTLLQHNQTSVNIHQLRQQKLNKTTRSSFSSEI